MAVLLTNAILCFHQDESLQEHYHCIKVQTQENISAGAYLSSLITTYADALFLLPWINTNLFKKTMSSNYIYQEKTASKQTNQTKKHKPKIQQLMSNEKVASCLGEDITYNHILLSLSNPHNRLLWRNTGS